MNKAAILGASLIVFYTCMMAVADGITKFIAIGYAAPQLFVLSSALVVIFCATYGRATGQSIVRVRAKGGMAIRSALTVVASIAFFQAFRFLPLAEVFLFIGLMPVLTAAMSGRFLRETPRPVVWAALAVGFSGILFLFPTGWDSTKIGHFWAALAVISGAGSIVAGRLIARVEDVALAQVFWPNLALMVAMLFWLPFVWKPMASADILLVAGYALALFAARYALAESLRVLPAYVATPMMNLQFVWMVLIGLVFFQEVPAMTTLIGVAMVVGSGIWLVLEEQMGRGTRVVPAE